MPRRVLGSPSPSPCGANILNGDNDEPRGRGVAAQGVVLDDLPHGARLEQARRTPWYLDGRTPRSVCRAELWLTPTRRTSTNRGVVCKPNERAPQDEGSTSV